MKLKAGDKIKIKYCVDENVEVGEVYEICSVEDSPYTNKPFIVIRVNNIPKWFLTNADEIEFEIVKENEDVKELTFREVIANIKEGEVWQDEVFLVYLDDNYLQIDFKNGHQNVPGVEIKLNDIFTLRRSEVDFETAFRACEEGKTIESCVSGDVYHCIHDETCFLVEEMRGRWYILI